MKNDLETPIETYEEWLRQHYETLGPKIVEQCIKNFQKTMEWGKAKKED